MTAEDKDTIYIDIDDEITAVIDKVRGSSGKIVALVLPKRATTLQSIVNMKLLKRAGDEAKKNLVLVTTETGLLPLAGAVGLHVAKTPTSRPEIPATPSFDNDREEQVDEDILADDEVEPATADNAGDKPVGDLAAGTTALAGRPAPESGIETVELDNAATDTAAPAAAVAAKPKDKKNKKLHIPDFDRFRLVLILGVLLLFILGIGGYFALAVLPKASIDIQTNASNVNTDIDFTLSTAATSLNASSKTVPAKQVQTQKTQTGAANATGQQNNGDKAAGSITMTICTNNPNATSPLPAGTGVSSNGHTYITQESAQFQYNGNCNNGFRFKTGDVNIKAQSGGAAFNTDNTSFQVSGRSDVSASGSADGGTDDIQMVISQADIDSAKAKISADSSDVQNDLKSQLEGQNLFAISATYNAGTPSVSANAKVGDAASNVTVTQVTTYTMLGAGQDDIKTLVDNDVKSQINTGAQSILDEGINQNAFKLRNLTAGGASMNIQTTAEVGPDINTDDIAKQAAGKKKGDIQSAIKNNPDVTDVTVKLSPFWVTKAPSKTSKITVTVAKPTKSSDAN